MFGDLCLVKIMSVPWTVDRVNVTFRILTLCTSKETVSEMMTAQLLAYMDCRLKRCRLLILMHLTLLTKNCTVFELMTSCKQVLGLYSI